MSRTVNDASKILKSTEPTSVFAPNAVSQPYIIAFFTMTFLKMPTTVATTKIKQATAIRGSSIMRP